jgi:hypothetical protein
MRKKIYEATYKYYEIKHPDSDNIPPTFDYTKERGISRMIIDFPSEKYPQQIRTDEEAIRAAEKFANDFYKREKSILPGKRKHLANKPFLEKLLEIFPPRRLKLS